MDITVKSYDSFKYVQVWKITEKRNGRVFDTESTDKYIEDEKAHCLPEGYVTSSISTSLTRQSEFTINVVHPSEFPPNKI